MDPKKFDKSADDNKSGKVQVGTVIEGAAEFYSSRLTKKQRRTNLVKEVMADPSSSDHASKKYKKMRKDRAQKAAKWKKRNANRLAKDFKILK